MVDDNGPAARGEQRSGFDDFSMMKAGIRGFSREEGKEKAWHSTLDRFGQQSHLRIFPKFGVSR